jgi:hypothetical protein
MERADPDQRAEIREYFGFRVFHAEDEPTFIAWSSERVTSPNPEAEAFKIASALPINVRIFSTRPPS